MVADSEDNKLSTKERRIAIIELAKTIGFWNLNQTELGTKFEVSRQQIGKDIKKIAKSMKPDDLNIIRNNLNLGFKRAVSECMSIFVSGTKKEKTREREITKCL